MSEKTASHYDGYADAYATYRDRREQGGIEGDPFGILPRLLELLGDIDGYLARVLHGRGARVTGIDISPHLIAQAERRNERGEITYRVADLSAPLPDGAERFDAAASYLVLNDVADYRGFAATLAAALAPGGRLVLALNNPYGAVVRKHVADYFDSDATTPYRGLWKLGIEVYHHHRTLGEYLDAFLTNGLHLVRLVDLPTVTSQHGPDTILPEGVTFPRFMLLAFVKPHRRTTAGGAEGATP